MNKVKGLLLAGLIVLGMSNNAEAGIWTGFKDNASKAWNSSAGHIVREFVSFTPHFVKNRAKDLYGGCKWVGKKVSGYGTDLNNARINNEGKLGKAAAKAESLGKKYGMYFVAYVAGQISIAYSIPYAVALSIAVTLVSGGYVALTRNEQIKEYYAKAKNANKRKVFCDGTKYVFVDGTKYVFGRVVGAVKSVPGIAKSVLGYFFSSNPEQQEQQEETENSGETEEEIVIEEQTEAQSVTQ